jgi:hypothetical protein
VLAILAKVLVGDVVDIVSVAGSVSLTVETCAGRPREASRKHLEVSRFLW